MIKQYKMMEIIVYLYDKLKKIVSNNIPVSVIRNTGIMDELVKIKYTIDNEHLEEFDKLKSHIDEIYNSLIESYRISNVQ